jgi:alpha-galactosidase/6-phospho-beta-glucosidase family protein
MIEASKDPHADLVAGFGAEKSREQIVPIMDALSFDNAGDFQINVPNKGGKLHGIPDNVVVEVPAHIDASGVQIKEFTQLPQKILLNHIQPEWLDMERDLYRLQDGRQKHAAVAAAERTPDQNLHDQAVVLLDELLNHEEIRQVEEFERFKEENHQLLL